MEGKEIREEEAEAMLVLIPKEAHPTTMRGFRPLSLCNMTLKVVSKIIFNRLKSVLKSLISPCQASFVSGMQGIDNVVLCQKFVHSLRFTTAKKGAVVIKVDIGKAYGHIDWGFIIRKTLEDAKILGNLSYVIMQLISKGSCMLLWNGETTNMINPSGELRHGDPLSPYVRSLHGMTRTLVGEENGRRETKAGESFQE